MAAPAPRNRLATYCLVANLDYGKHATIAQLDDSSCEYLLTLPPQDAANVLQELHGSSKANARVHSMAGYARWKDEESRTIPLDPIRISHYVGSDGVRDVYSTVQTLRSRHRLQQ